MAADLYTVAHKSLRLAVSDTAALIGATAPDSVADLATPVSKLVEELRGHAGHEDQFIDPLLGRFLPDIGCEVAAQHERLEASLDAVQRQLDALTTAATVADGGPISLYRAVQRMAAMNLLHLDYEETVVMPALWTAAPPEALTDVMTAFQAAHPEAAQLFHTWPEALTPTERANFGVGERELVGARDRGADRW